MDDALDELLYDAQDDWLPLVGAEGSVRTALGDVPPRPEVHRLMIEALAQLLSDGLLVVGVADAQGFHPWEPTEAGHVARLEVLVSNGTSFEWGYSAWFDLTPEGQLRAATIPHPPDKGAPPAGSPS